MRDIKRIQRIQDKFTKLWKKYPDQRWGQFLINQGIVFDDAYIWQVEDDNLERQLDMLLKKNKHKPIKAVVKK